MDDLPTGAPFSAHLAWKAEALWRQLEPYLPGISVEVVAQAESTNTVLIERARRGGGRHDAPITTPGELEAMRQRGGRDGDGGPYGRRSGDTQPCLLVAEHQSLGRGRLGRGWLSAPGSSLTFSLALPMAPRDWSGLSLAVGVAIADALEPPEPDAAAPRIGLKWPNDLWLMDGGLAGAGRKLGGVLIETVAVGDRRMVVVGVGLNLAPLPAASAAAPRELTHGYGCLQELSPSLDAPAVLHRIALPLVRALSQFEREGFAGFAPAYARRDLLCGRAVAAIDSARADASFAGTAEGVASNGALKVRGDDGTLRDITSGEVSVRLAASAS